APAPARAAHRPARAAGFAAASAALVLVFVSAGTPIPLYNSYRAQDGLTNADLSVVTVVYLAAAALSLLVLGRLSDHLGRRPVGVGALVSSALGLLVLLGVDGVGALAAGRLLQGLATGLASSALGALAVDCAPERPRWLPAVVTSAAPMLGIPAGALLSGALVDHAPAPRHLVYSAVAVLLLTAAALVALGPEPVARTTARRALASLRPRVLVPAGAGRPLLAVTGLILATWSVGGFYQAFGPSIAADQLGSEASLTAAAVFGSFTLLSVLGGPLTARLRPERAVRLGALAYALCVAGVLLALRAEAIGPFLGASLLAGVAQGAAQTGGMGTLLARTAPGERAGLLSTVFLVNYSSAAVPGLVAGRLTQTFSMLQIAAGYGALVLVGVGAAPGARRPPRLEPARRR
ncbi:MFS transporter, partial [Kineococcus indalonis]|uniref:MFS transporter n=1 Tax=Kineococcus indalonis TaxID=2696566 RepID=UPI0014130DDC